MNDPYLKIKFNKKEYNVYKIDHVSEKRINANRKRDYDIKKQGYETILLNAFKKGLRGFGDSSVAITFMNFKQEKISILVEQVGTDIVILSVFTNWKNSNIPDFIKVKNRINLIDFILPEAGEEGNKFFNKPLVLLSNKLTSKRKKIRRIVLKDKKLGRNYEKCTRQ